MKQLEKIAVGTQIEWNLWGDKFFEIRFTLTYKAFLILVMAVLILVLSFNLIRASRAYNNPYDTQKPILKASQTPLAEALPTELPVSEIIASEPTNPLIKESERVQITFSTSEAKLDSAYIRRFQKVAIAEMEKYGIPASISMAQGILESDAGQSRLAREANNHFGIKCKQRNCARGHCMNYHDNSHKDFFLKYENAWASWRDHSNLLSNPDWRYAYMIKSCGNDYECWAKGLKKAGYAYPGKTYDQKLIKIIKIYQLHKLDQKQLLFN